MIYTCPVHDFVFPKSHFINMLKHYIRPFNTSDYLAEIHYGSVFSFFALRIVSLRAALVSLIPLFLIPPGSGKSHCFQTKAVSFKRGYEKLNRYMFRTYDVSCTSALSRLECDVVNMGTIQVRKQMSL